jgi:anti-sigma B factor antagonist
MEHSSLTVAATRTGQGCTLAISGDLDLTTAETLAPAVTQALGAVNGQPAPVLLDLSGLAFLDCAGARALATAVQALPSGNPVTMGPISPAASRLLDLIGWNPEHLPPTRPATTSQKVADRQDSPASTHIPRQPTMTDQQASLTLTPVTNPQTDRLAAGNRPRL